MDNKPKIVAEGCCNHMGDFNIAKEMIKTASQCGADYIKWQKRNPIESVPIEWRNKRHPNSNNSFGETYLKHREFLEFSQAQHKELKICSEEYGIGYACSVWDKTSAIQIIELNPDFIKIPSAANMDLELIEYIHENYKGDIHISLGMLRKHDRDRLLIDEYSKFRSKLVLYHTTTEYPCPFKHLCLKEIKKLKTLYDVVGYSGHNYGIAADMVALAYGATWIERHFTLDRTFKGTDHAASLEPDGLRKLCRDCKNIHEALKYKDEEVEKAEIENSGKLRTYNPYK